MATATSDIMVEIKGQNKSLNDALKESSAELAALGGGTNKAATETTKMGEAAEGASKKERELGEAVKIAAENIGLLGLESGESTGKLFLMRDAANDFTKSMGSMRAALVGGALLTAAFTGLDFLKESVKDAMAGEQATAQLNNALKRTPEIAKQTNEAIEAGEAGWAHYGQGVAEVKAAVAKGAALGIDPKVILDNRKGVEDLAHAMGGDLMTAISSLTAGGERSGRSLRLLNLSMVEQQRLSKQLAYTQDPTARFKMITAAIENSGLAGAADAQAGTAQGKFLAFNKSLENLRETVGTNLLPVVTDMATALTGMVAGANSALAAFGGLSQFLQATWRPILIGGTLLFVGLKLAHTQLGQFLKSTFLGDVSESAGALADEGIQAAKAADALNSIPKDVTTTAQFISAAATAVKEPWIANVLSVPKVALTTAVFDNATAVGAMAAEEGQLAAIPKTVTSVGEFVPASAEVTAYEASLNAIPRAETTLAAFIPATAGVTAYEGELAAIPKTVTTTAVFNPASIGTSIAVGATVSVVATAAQVLLAPHALDGVKGALGQMFATLTGANVKSGVTITVPATATVGGATVKRGTIVSMDGKVTIASVTVPPKEKVEISGTGRIASITIPKGTTFTATGTGNVTSVTVKPGTTIQVGGAAEINNVRVKRGLTISNVRGTVEIDNATVAPGKKLTVGNVGGTAIISNVIPAPGKHLTISGVNGTAEIDGVTLKKGATVHVSGGTATIDTLEAKNVKVNIGPMGQVVGFDKNKPVPYYIKYEAVNQPPKPPTTKGGGGGGGGGTDWGGTAVNIGLGLTESVITALLFKKFMGGGGGGTGGGTGAPLGDVNKQVDTLIESLSGNPKTIGAGAAAGTGAQAKKLIDSLLGGADAPKAKDISYIDPSLFKAQLGTAFNTAIKGMNLAAPLGLAFVGALASAKFTSQLKLTLPTIDLSKTKLTLPTFDVGKMFSGINTFLVAEGPKIGLVLVAAIVAGLLHQQIPSAVAKMAGIAGGPTSYDGPGGGVKRPTKKQEQAMISANEAPFKALGSWINTNIVNGIKGDIGAFKSAGAGLVTAFSDAIKAGWSGLTQRISALFNDLINAVLKPVNDMLSHIPGTHPIPLAGAHTASKPVGHAGHQAIFTPLPASLAGGSTAHAVAAHHAAMTKPVVHHHAAAKHTTTIHQTNTFNVNGAKDPHATALEVQRALQSVATAAARKRQHGR